MKNTLRGYIYVLIGSFFWAIVYYMTYIEITDSNFWWYVSIGIPSSFGRLFFMIMGLCYLFKPADEYDFDKLY
jgi:hypothetical protein